MIMTELHKNTFTVDYPKLKAIRRFIFVDTSKYEILPSVCYTRESKKK